MLYGYKLTQLISYKQSSSMNTELVICLLKLQQTSFRTKQKAYQAARHISMSCLV